MPDKQHPGGTFTGIPLHPQQPWVMAAMRLAGSSCSPERATLLLLTQANLNGVEKAKGTGCKHFLTGLETENVKANLTCR